MKSSLEGLVTIQQMKQFVDDGLTDKEIAEKFYVSTNVVYRFRRKHGLNKHRGKIVRDVGTYYRMKECLLTDEQIAYVWNMSRRALYDWKKREGLEGVAIQTTDVYHDGTPIKTVIVRREKQDGRSNGHITK